MPGPRIDKHRREGLRASILQILQVARPYGCSEKIMLLALDDVDENVGPNELRRELTYLEDKELIEVDASNGEIWKAQLTSYGVDVVEGAADLPPGIAKIRY